jgi:hypothetical protein
MGSSATHGRMSLTIMNTDNAMRNDRNISATSIRGENQLSGGRQPPG